MACPTSLSPASQLSSCRLPPTGTASDVNNNICFGIYSSPTSDLYSVDFLSGAAEQVNYTYKMLGGDILDIELKTSNVYSCYEEAVLEYSYLMNIHQSKNVLSNILGATTGTFDHDGNLKSGSLKTSLSGSHVALKYPKISFAYPRRVAEGISAEVGIGNNTVYSASFTTVADQQDYDLQTIISSSAATSGYEFSGLLGNKKIMIRKVFYKTPAAMWRFFGFYGGFSSVGYMSSYGQFASNTSFEILPTWQDKLQAMTYEDAIYTRCSHYSYEIHNNKLRLYPVPNSGSPTKFWITFSIPEDAFEENQSVDEGISGVNNMGTAPFSNIPYNNINSIGKQWIRRFALACTKGVLAQVRSKFATLPIPGNDVTLNYSQLFEQSEKEKETLREELKTVLDELTYTKLAEKDATLLESTSKVLEKIPNLIYVG